MVGRYHFIRRSFDFGCGAIFHGAQVEETTLSLGGILAEPSGFGGFFDGGDVRRDGLFFEFTGEIEQLLDVCQFDFFG